MITHNLHIKSISNDYSEYIKQSTGLFYKLYNKAELMADDTFISECLSEFNLIDKSIYDCVVTDVNCRKNQQEAILVGIVSTILLKFFIDFVVFLFFKIGDFIDELKFNKIYYKIENNNIKSNIFLEYLKAVKNKICSFIEYKD